MNDAAEFTATRFLAPRFWTTWLALAFLWCAARLPYALQLALGRAVGRLMQHTMEERRRIARINLGLCFPDWTSEQRDDLLARHFESLGISLIETAMAWWAPERKLRSLCQLEGLNHLRDALSAGKGVILLSAHFTTLEIGGRLLALETPFHVLYRKFKNPLFDAVMKERRRTHFKKAIDREDIRGIVHSLRENMPVWYAPDQDYGAKHSVFVPFLGVTAATITATARLAEMSGAPVVPFFPHRRDDARGYRLQLLPALENFPTADPERDAQRINALIETEVLKRPEQYLWIHRRFKTRPAGAPYPYGDRN